MCLRQIIKTGAGLILLHHVAVSVVQATSNDEPVDLLPALLKTPRSRLLDHKKRQSKYPIADDLSTDAQGDEKEGHRALGRLLARKQKKKKDNREPNDDQDTDRLVMKKKKKDEKKKMKKYAGAKAADKKKGEEMYKGISTSKVEEKKTPVMDAAKSSSEQWSGWNADNGCICDDWAGDSWSGEQGLPIGWSENGWEFNEYYAEDLKNLRSDIVQLIHDTDRDLLPKCLRLAFHDCIDGCNGCIDMNVLDNRGLEDPIELLFPLVQKYQHKLSRSDVWAHCAIVSADMAVVDNRPQDLNFYMHYIGRKDCEGADEKGYGGPVVEMYEPHLTNHEMIEFFHERFGFDAYEVVVLMGVHSAAVAHRENLGFGNPGREDGWIHDGDEYKLSNLYYNSMLQHVWELQKVENAGVVPDRYQWYFDEEDIGPIMLTSDMSLIFDLTGFIATDKEGVGGKVMCLTHEDAEFEVGEEGDPDHVPLCPMAKQTRDIVEELEKDNTQFLYAFVIVLNKMITNGYDTHHSMSKSGKSKNEGKSGKWGRNLKHDDHSTWPHGREDDYAEVEETTTTDHLTEKKAEYGWQSSGKPKSSGRKWCSC